ncbi:MAG TPA: DUF58 domain-containing protein [Candidatus Baltobacteraceae bacterium]|nr:DUF58 domain-containing protein [Candidatus Baltobacteraceae bacterium]
MNGVREALLRGRKRPARTGAGSPVHYRGDGYEFVELREYVPGDDVRRIDWAATARTGSLQTRVVLEDVSLTFGAIVDTSGSMQAGRQRALIQAASEIEQAWFSCAMPADRCFRVTDGDLVAPWEEAKSALIQSCATAAAALPRGSALLVVSDFYDLPDDDDTIALLGMRYDCTALIAVDPWRKTLPLSGFVRVRDSETDRARVLFIGQAERERYRHAVDTRERALLERLQRANFRTGTFREDESGEIALLRAFGLR